MTGGAGRIGGMLLDRPPRAGWRYVVLDEAAATVERPDVNVLRGSITDPEAVRGAMRGVTDVVHLAGIPGEDTWDEIALVNIEGTRNVLEAAAAEGVGRFVFASSNHAVGLAEIEEGLPDDAPPRPDSYYGWSKAAGEALVRLYCERYGMVGVAVRIGGCSERPTSLTRMAVWLSPRDARALVDAALENDYGSFAYVWGVSANTRNWLSRDGARRIGYEPVDDSEVYADELDGVPETRLGGGTEMWELGVPKQRARR
jgi:uronate dehydrogenase